MTTRRRKGSAFEPAPTTVGNAWDSAFEALRSIRDREHIPNEKSMALRDACREMQDGIRRMLEYPPIADGGDDLRRMLERLDRIIELANMQECGALIIEVQRVMEAAYKRFP